MLICMDCGGSYYSWPALQYHQHFGECATPTLAGGDLTPFGRLVGGVSVDREIIARVAHEAHRALQLELGETNLAAPWDEAPEWLRDSTRRGIGEALDGASPAELHEAWCAQRFGEGWRFGEVKDAEAKTHPLLRDYDALPNEQRAKDELMTAIVGALR